jgi:hypothetical protein
MWFNTLEFEQTNLARRLVLEKNSTNYEDTITKFKINKYKSS